MDIHAAQGLTENTHALEVIAGLAGTLIVAMLGYLINVTTSLKNELVTLRLDVTKELGKKVSVDACSDHQQKCVGLNDIIIKQPLNKEDEALWQALKHHSHKGLDDNGEVVFREGRDGKR